MAQQLGLSLATVGKALSTLPEGKTPSRDDWARLSPEDYEASKQDLVETTIEALTKYIPNLRDILERASARETPDWVTGSVSLTSVTVVPSATC